MLKYIKSVNLCKGTGKKFCGNFCICKNNYGERGTTCSIDN